MREMKDSGIEWIGEIPKGWGVVRVKEKYKFNSGFTPETSHQEYYNDVDGYEWATISDLNNGKIDNPTKSTISREFVKFNHKKQIPSGCVLYSFKLTVGQVAVNDRPIFTNEAIMSFYPEDETNLNFFKYSASLIEYSSNTNIYGAKILNQQLISNAYIVYPPFQEQSRIASFLDSKCSEIDSLHSDINEQIETLKEYKKSVITEAVTKGLNPDAEMKDSGIEWCSRIPANWKTMPNKYVMRKVKEICPIYNDEDILSLTMNGVIKRDLDAGGKMPSSFNGYQKIYPGNLLMCLFDYDVTPRCIGLIKNKGLTSPAYSQFVMKNNNSASYYYYYYLMIDNTKELLHLAKNLRHSFTEEQLGDIKTPVPPLEEQKQIADYLDSKCSEIDSIIESKQQQLETLEQYKKSLIYEYVTGKKEVPANA